MSQEFFKVRPIEWVDLPLVGFDRWGERIASEAVLSSPIMPIPMKIYERELDGRTWFTVSINSTTICGSFDTIGLAKIYAEQMLQANIALLILPVYTAPEAKILHDTEQTND